MKKIIIISFIVVLLSLGAVSATDDSNQTAPDIQVPEKIWKYGDNNITIEAKETTQIEISGAVKYNATVNPGKTSVPINLSTGRHNIYINSSDALKEYNITVLKENPHWNLDFDFMEEGEKLYGDAYDHELIDDALIVRNMPESLTGNFSFYVNDELKLEWNVNDFPEDGLYYGEYYQEKTYNFTLKYSGDDYFYPVSKSKIVQFVPVRITIPEEVILGENDMIYISSDYDDRNGNVIIKINNKTVFNKRKGIYTLEYSLKKLEVGKQYDIEVTYSSPDYNKTKNARVTVYDRMRDYVELKGKDTYSQDNFRYVYGESNIYYILSPKIALDIRVDGEMVESAYDDGYYLVDIDDFAPGTHNITVRYKGDKYYGKNTFTGEFEVISKAKCLGEVELNDTNEFLLFLPDDAVGNVTIDIKKPWESEFKYYTTVEVEDSMAYSPLPTDHVGNYHIKAYFTGNYEINEIIGQYLVNDGATWTLDDDYTYIDDIKVLRLEMDYRRMGNLSVEIKKDGKAYENYTIEVLEGMCEIELPTDHMGKYSVRATFEGNCELIPYETTYYVESPYYITVSSNYPTYDSREFVLLELPQDAVGNMIVEIRYGENGTYAFYRSVELENGKASIRIPTDRIGKLYINAFYTGNYELENLTDNEIIVSPAYTLKNNIVTLIVGNQTNGTFQITDWWSYEVNVKTINGRASVDLTKYRKRIDEEMWLALKFISDNGEEYDADYICIKPIYDIKIVSKDVKMYYGDSKLFKAKIYRNGKAVGKGKYVTIKIGSTSYKVKTDKNGIAKVKITQTPNKYKITVKYLVKTKKNALTVKQVLTLKTAKIKKSARKLVLQATLKKGKKPIKGKTIKFKFKGKTYKAKTNKYGIAKVTIKKSVLKKLKKGKKVTYQATYLKNTVKKTAKVRR